jgi:hypothetical protein
VTDHNTEFASISEARLTIAASAQSANEKRAVLRAIKLFCADQRQSLLVSLYVFGLVGGLAWRREVARRALLIWTRAFLRARFSKKLRGIAPDSGFCFRAPGPRRAISDQEGVSMLIVLEDETPLSAPHTPHNEIRRLGRGRYSHWGRYIYFSSTDNTDPRKNGRSYKLVQRV